MVKKSKYMTNKKKKFLKLLMKFHTLIVLKSLKVYMNKQELFFLKILSLLRILKIMVNADDRSKKI